MKILIRNIKTLVQVREKSAGKVRGALMRDLPCLDNAWLLIKDGLIAGYGKMETLPGQEHPGVDISIDASGRLVFPCWCDSHTHLVYAGSREKEFTDRINGLTYEEIAKRGGGILNSARKLQETPDEVLFSAALNRLEEITFLGTGAVEIKSGYGLTLKDELRMLRVIKKLKELTPLSIKATFLGAHAVPSEYKGNKIKYVDLVVNEMLPAVAEEGLADFCDVFCEEGYFTKDETIRILTAAAGYGIKGKVHAEQLSHTGGVEAGVDCNAASVDHLEYVNDRDIALLAQSGVVPTLLPGAQFFLGLPHPPARKMIDSGLAVAVASDYNPGSSPSGNMNLMTALCCIQYKMTPAEAVNASTMNSAFAMGVESSHGSITLGKTANIFITEKMPGYEYLPYSFGSNLIDTVIINGKIINKKK